MVTKQEAIKDIARRAFMAGRNYGDLSQKFDDWWENYAYHLVGAIEPGKPDPAPTALERLDEHADIEHLRGEDWQEWRKEHDILTIKAALEAVAECWERYARHNGFSGNADFNLHTFLREWEPKK